MGELELWLAFLGVLLSAVTVVAGYGFNAKFQRDFEKRKTKYHEKLKTYERMNSALRRVVINFSSIKQVDMRDRLTDSSEKLNVNATAMMLYLASAREDERLVGGSTAQEKLDQYYEMSLEKKDMSGKNVTTMTNWLIGALDVVKSLRFGLAFRYGDEFDEGYDQAGILTDDEDVISLADETYKFLFSSLAIHASSGKDVFPFSADLSRLENLHTRLKDAMRADLDRTL